MAPKDGDQLAHVKRVVPYRAHQQAPPFGAQLARGERDRLDFHAGILKAPRVSQPGLDKTGPVPVHPPTDSVPIEQLMPKKELSVPGVPTFQMVPVAPQEPPPPVTPGVKASAAAAKPAGN